MFVVLTQSPVVVEDEAAAALVNLELECAALAEVALNSGPRECHVAALQGYMAPDVGHEKGGEANTVMTAHFQMIPRALVGSWKRRNQGM